MGRKNITPDRMKGYMAEALLLLMQKKPFKEITIQEIADRAGVNRSTYYRNFFSKEEIILFYLDGMIASYLRDYGESRAESLEDYLLVLFRHFYNHQKALLCIYKNGLAYLLMEALNSRFEDYYGLKASNRLTQYRVGYHLGGIYNHFLIWFSGGMSEKPEQMTRIALTVLPKGTLPFLRQK